MNLYQYIRRRHLEDILTMRRLLREFDKLSFAKALRQRKRALQVSLAKLRKNRKEYGG